MGLVFCLPLPPDVGGTLDIFSTVQNYYQESASAR